MSFENPYREAILNLMKGDWSVEILERGNNEVNNLAEIDFKLSNVDFALGFLTPYSPKQSIIDKLKNPRIIIKKEEITSFGKENSLDSLVRSIVDDERDLKTIESDQKEKEEIINSIKQFGSLSFVPRDTKTVNSFVVKTDLKKEREYVDFFGSKKIFSHLISHYQGKVYFSVILLKSLSEETTKFIEKNSGETVEYDYNIIPSKKNLELEQEITKLDQSKEKIIKSLFDKGQSSKDLKIYYDLLLIKKRKLVLAQRTLNGSFLNYISLWASKEEKEKLTNETKNISGSIKIIEAKTEENESPPVFLENSPAISPFQAVTSIFGLPGSKEIDPTPYLSVFFIIFFGICITDAGYGLILAAVTGSLLLFFKESFQNNNLIKLLFYAGISTIIMGVLFGSYFGVSAAGIGLPFLAKFKVIDPIKDTLLFMGIAFLLGYIQICFAQIVRIIKSKKQNDKDGMMAGFAWFSFYIFAGVYLLSFQFEILKQASIVGLIFFGLSLFIVEGKGQNILLIPLIGGVKVLQGMINTVSDILSYSRLMALGLGTGVIALIVNQIAFLLGGMIPYVGWILTGLILIFGHLFNLAINSLGGFIHSARLQFVEFFPKFMEGGGRRLNLLGEELKYIKIN